MKSKRAKRKTKRTRSNTKRKASTRWERDAARRFGASFLDPITTTAALMPPLNTGGMDLTRIGAIEIRQ